MSDDLLPYYEKELTFIRRMGAQFAELRPDIAARLRLGPDDSQDPHVERMIEAFALLAARVRHKLDDDFPELTSALVSVLYPHYQAPIPSMSIAQFALDRSQGDLAEGYPIPVRSAVETEPVDGTPCIYQTAYPVHLWPMEVSGATLSGLPGGTPAQALRAEPTSLLRIELECFAKEMTFGKLQIPAIRFFLKGQDQHVFPLYELILNNMVALTVGNPQSKEPPAFLPLTALRPVGFEPGEMMLKYPPTSFVGYGLLSEYFAFPRKFLFFDIAGLSPDVLRGVGKKLEIGIYLDAVNTDLEKVVAPDLFRLGCTPIVNLFEQVAEPIRLTETETEYRIVPSSREPKAYEIYSVDQVTGISAKSDTTVQYQPFYSVHHGGAGNARTPYWHSVRRFSEGDSGDHGTEVFLSFADLNGETALVGDSTLEVRLTCLNRDMPNRLVFGGGRPVLRLAEGGPLAPVECLVKPTDTLRPLSRPAMFWRLISHLSLNHLSLCDTAGKALREILMLYDLSNSDETRSRIASIVAVRGKRAVARVHSGGEFAICRGVEVQIEFDEARFRGVYLLASVIERFLGLYANINSFSKLVATSRQREKVIHSWLPRTAERVLL